MKIEKQNTKILGLIAIGVILILSIPAYKLIPFGTPDGLDFNNVYAYSRCDKVLNSKFEGNFYLANGTDCGDAMARPFVYPPLLYYSAKWVSVFDTFESARIAWRIFIILGTLWAISIWLGSLRRFLISLPFTALLFVQYPMLFALERGNNDILVLLLWTVAYYLYKKDHLKTSGFFSSATVLMKIYPLFALSIITGGLILSREFGRLKKYLIGAFIGAVTIFIAFNSLWYSFYLKIKEFAGSRMVLDILNHSVQYITDVKLINMTIFLLLLFLWVLRFRFDQTRSDLVFAGGLAVCTYYSATSFDYNLITAYPLLIILLADLIAKFKTRSFIIAIGLTIGLCGNRYWFIWGNDVGYKVRLLIQIVFLMLIAIESFPLFHLKNIVKYQIKRIKLYVTN